MCLYVFNIELLNEFVICLNTYIFISYSKSIEHFGYERIF